MTALDHDSLLYPDWILLSADDNSVIDVATPPQSPSMKSSTIVATEELGASLRSEFGNFDISRIPARIFFLGANARNAVRNEFRGLTIRSGNGIPIGQRSG